MPAVTLDLRYSGLDANGHVNHTAFFDLLHTALLRNGLSPQPQRIEMQFQHEITPDTLQVEVRVEKRDGSHTAFSLGNQTTGYAQGLVA